MQESKRQRQVAAIIEQEMNDIFRREGLNVINGGMISISKVVVTPDLMEVRIYLSFYQFADPKSMMGLIKSKEKELRKMLGERIKNQVRKIPVIHYFEDDTLEYASKIDELFKNLHIPPAQE